ncbi:MAG TPA: hypothetical protein VG797_03500, partial [Phycisphaerales bacterium]|nr:hypothetical protein [Phycisphaerales bacterium]
HRLRRDPLTNELYITDVPALLMNDGKRVEVISAVPPEDVLSVNTPAQLAEVERILVKRQGGHAAAGMPRELGKAGAA